MSNWPLEDSVSVLGYSQLEKLFYELQKYFKKSDTLYAVFNCMMSKSVRQQAKAPFSAQYAFLKCIQSRDWIVAHGCRSHDQQ